MTFLPFSTFSYSSHLEFFQDAYEYLHSQDETISYEIIANSCGFKSRTHARNLIKGAHDATLSELRVLGNYFKLESEEIKYLECLFEFQQAQASPAAYELFKKLMVFQKKRALEKNPLKDIEIATSLLHMTLLSVLDLKSQPQDFQKIRELLKNRFSLEEIENGLKDLLQAGFIKKDVSAKRWLLIHKHVKKIDLNPNFFLRKFHAQCLEVARTALETETPQERYLVGANFAINEKVFPRIVQKLNAFLENLLQLEGVAGGADTVVQVNAQLIKMTASAPEKTERVLGDKNAEREFVEKENTVIV